jgi:import inner membrane translocase subunit TIM10
MWPFGAASNSQSNYTSSIGKSNELAQFEQQVELMDMLFKNLIDSCKMKCISPPYKDPSLSKGEAVCVDRCAEKYFAVLEAVSQNLASKQQQQ